MQLCRAFYGLKLLKMITLHTSNLFLLLIFLSVTAAVALMRFLTFQACSYNLITVRVILISA